MDTARRHAARINHRKAHRMVQRLLAALFLAALPVSPCSAQGLVQPEGRSLPQELQAAAEVLSRLMQANPSVDEPVTLVVLPFRSAGCGGQGSQPAGKIPTCLSSLDLPPVLAQSFFVAYVFSLRAQADPSSDPDLGSAAVMERRILLNSARAFPLGNQEGPACLIGRELASIQMGQLQRRQESLRSIDGQLASRIQAAAGKARSNQGMKELGLFLFSPLQMALSKATTPEVANPMSAMLVRSAHWRVVQEQAPSVAAALQPLGGVSEELALRSWREVDGFIAFALQDRDALLQKQREQAESHALSLLAMAGIDPRSCAAAFSPPPSAADLEPALRLLEAARSRPTQPVPPLPRRFRADRQTVVIHPRTSPLPRPQPLTPGLSP